MQLRLSNPLRIHYGPRGTTRLDDAGHAFNVSFTSSDGNSVISRSVRSRYRADEVFSDLAGLEPNE